MCAAPSGRNSSRTHCNYCYLLVIVIFIAAACECYASDDSFERGAARSGDSVGDDEDANGSADRDLKGRSRDRYQRGPYGELV